MALSQAARQVWASYSLAHFRKSSQSHDMHDMRAAVLGVVHQARNFEPVADPETDGNTAAWFGSNFAPYGRSTSRVVVPWKFVCLELIMQRSRTNGVSQLWVSRHRFCSRTLKRLDDCRPREVQYQYTECKSSTIAVDDISSRICQILSVYHQLIYSSHSSIEIRIETQNSGNWE
ncbi:hypothetical protein BDN72DRAFT_578182 [Pluteus cervinus]|uniref:Uncharacterized protein n=1 Tax=Pluteus cervinus TaxID=181527 RepID=A0ACD3AVZ8_9AGAR|nr:hypothetical protein BDN72DRAFT_578182 [Pluteus cervinus]